MQVDVVEWLVAGAPVGVDSGPGEGKGIGNINRKLNRGPQTSARRSPAWWLPDVPLPGGCQRSLLCAVVNSATYLHGAALQIHSPPTTASPYKHFDILKNQNRSTHLLSTFTQKEGAILVHEKKNYNNNTKLKFTDSIWV